MISRTKYYDNLKFIAFFMVIFIHAGAKYLYDGGVPIQTFSGMFVNIIYSFSRPCVPIFFMVSGALLYKSKDINIKKFYKNKFFNIILPFLIVASLTFVIDTRYNLNFASIIDFIKKILEQNYTYHFWYVYSLIQILLLAPLLKKVVDKSNKKEFLIYIFVLLLGTCFITSIDDFFILFHKTLNMKLLPNIFCYIGYTFLGYYLANNDLSKKSFNLILILALLSIIYTIFGTFYISSFASFETFYKYDTVNVLFPSIAMFILFKKYFDKKYFFTGFANFTYYGYLIHILILNFFVNKLNAFNPVTGFKSLAINLLIAVICTGIFALCFGYLYYVIDNKIKKRTKHN